MEFANTDWNEFIKRYIEYNNSENKDIYKQAEAIKRKMQDVLSKHNFWGTLEKDVALYETIFRPYDNAISILGIPELEWEDFKDFRQKLYERKAEGTEQWKAYNEPLLIGRGFEIYMQAIVFYATLKNTLECLQFRIEWKKEEAEHKRILDILTPASNKEEETAVPALQQQEELLKIKEELSDLFNLTFKGKNATKTNYVEYLLKDLLKPINRKEMHKICYMAYTGGYLTNKPATFADFKKDFFSIIGIQPGKYKPNQLTPTGEDKNKYYYLIK